MAAKRLPEEADKESDIREGKRIRSLPSFTMVIRKAMAANCIQNLCLALEPVVRRVVQEEVERGLVRRACLLQRSPQMLIEEAKPSCGLQLIFKKQPSLSIFTENRIEDDDGYPLEILLVDTATGKKPITSFSSSIKVELVVLDGDFPCDDSDNWSTVDFNRHIVKERTGRRPLLTGDIALTLKNGETSIDELKFTDNSSWIRSRHFRIGARVSSGSLRGFDIREAATSRFMVKDHRGEAYKKNYPPALGDDVWRLEKIGKEGAFHKKLMAKNIKTVQDFLKLSVIDSPQLQKILGMSPRNWEAAIYHAKTCPLGDKLYIHQCPPYSIVLSPICEVVNIAVDGVSWTFQELSMPMRATVQELVLEAYNCWDRLEEISLPPQD
ncbi:protein SAR DEFICIENT 1 isoform X2 [Dendrobium catenatum]|uniref:protein SAR DEFICIENT 1 isoform X2 n=1 Tax=Dendrobium catenatum TaxID=906689 RepID=UPI0010A0AD86|nr:protein SAR DEFICIENT 1 isoform X2 [Dendrobium catenatum]